MTYTDIIRNDNTFAKNNDLVYTITFRTTKLHSEMYDLEDKEKGMASSFGFRLNINTKEPIFYQIDRFVEKLTDNYLNFIYRVNPITYEGFLEVCDSVSLLQQARYPFRYETGVFGILIKYNFFDKNGNLIDDNIKDYIISKEYNENTDLYS